MPKIEFEFEKETYRMFNLEKVMDLYAKAVRRAAQANLRKQDKNATGTLSRTIKLHYEVKKYDVLIYPVTKAAPYWEYVDLGVQGFLTNRKAPDSPFKFGTGTGPKGKLVPAIDRWTIVKPVMDVRDAKGKFIPRKSLVRMIARSVYLHGLKTTHFISDPMSTKWDNYADRITEALAKDLEQVYDKVLPDEITWYIG